jgi:hypothetical protein
MKTIVCKYDIEDGKPFRDGIRQGWLELSNDGDYYFIELSFNEALETNKNYEFSIDDIEFLRDFFTEAVIKANNYGKETNTKRLIKSY